MFNLEGCIPKVFQLAQEFGDNDRALQLRAAGLRTLASMVPYIVHSFVLMAAIKIEKFLDIIYFGILYFSVAIFLAPLNFSSCFTLYIIIW